MKRAKIGKKKKEREWSENPTKFNVTSSPDHPCTHLAQHTLHKTPCTNLIMLNNEKRKFQSHQSVHMTYVMSTKCKKIIKDCFPLNPYLPIVVDLASKDRILHASTFMYFVGLTNTTLNENLEDTDGEKSNRTRKQTTKKNTCKAFSIKVHWRSYFLGAEWNRDTCLVTSLFAIWWGSSV